MVNHKRLLVVEDDYILAHMYKERFGAEGYEVVSADNGEDGIDEALAGNFDLVILDLMLPKRGGLSVLQILRSRPETEKIPVIIITNHPDDRYREIAEKYGIEDFVFKAEIMPKDVIDRINKIIKKYDASAFE
ncbi:MAG: response regulator [Patescibacteria group bacterium]|jgi:DNA-binding response OmpR family regulator